MESHLPRNDRFHPPAICLFLKEPLHLGDFCICRAFQNSQQTQRTSIKGQICFRCKVGSCLLLNCFCSGAETGEAVPWVCMSWVPQGSALRISLYIPRLCGLGVLWKRRKSWGSDPNTAGLYKWLGVSEAQGCSGMCSRSATNWHSGDREILLGLIRGEEDLIL